MMIYNIFDVRLIIYISKLVLIETLIYKKKIKNKQTTIILAPSF